MPPETNAENPLPKRTPIDLTLLLLGTVAFLYFARPVVLPVFLAILAAMALKPLMRWLSFLRIPTAVSAAIIFVLLGVAIGIGDESK